MIISSVPVILRPCTSKPSPTAAPRPPSCCARAIGMTGGYGNERCSTSPIGRPSTSRACAACSRAGSCCPGRAALRRRALAAARVRRSGSGRGARHRPGPAARVEKRERAQSPARPRHGDDRRPHHRAGLEARHRQGARSRHRRLEPRRRTGLRRGRRGRTLRGARLAARASAADRDRPRQRHLKGGTLVLYDVSSSYVEGRCCPLANAATTGTARRASCRSSTACCALPTAAPSPSRCSKATPAIP